MRDLDGDGKPVIIFVMGGVGGMIADAKINPTDPTTPWPVVPISEPKIGFGHGPGTGDINGDGRVDVIQSASGGNNRRRAPLAPGPRARFRTLVGPEPRAFRPGASAHGLIRSSFVPPAAIHELRDLTRTRKQLVREKSRNTRCGSNAELGADYFEQRSKVQMTRRLVKRLEALGLTVDILSPRRESVSF